MHYPAIPCNIIKYHMIKYNPKNTIFVPKLGNFGQSGPYNGPPSSQMGTYRKTEAIQSCLRIRGSYDAIESGPSEPKKRGLYGCSVKKSDFWGNFGPKWTLPPPQDPAPQCSQHKNVVFLVSRHDGNKFFG